jgi:hypothetical protein
LLGSLLLLALLACGASAGAETVQKGGVRVSVVGTLSPRALPRSSLAPVEVSLATTIASTTTGPPPQLRRITIAINRYGRLDRQGLPVCHLEEIQPASNEAALQACRGSLVGEGSFSAEVLFEGQAPFPSHGKLYAFNGELDGKPAILAHVYGSHPAPASYTLPFVVSRATGTFGVTLRASLPSPSSSGYITGISLRLGRSFTAGGKKHSYVSATCPAPKGFSGAVFPLAKTSFAFANANPLSSTVTSHCKARD